MNILNLEESSAVLYRKIKEKGRLSIGRLSSAELLDAIKLNNVCKHLKYSKYLLSMCEIIIS